MYEAKTLQQDIERLNKRTQNTPDLSIDILEDMYGELIYLRESMDDIVYGLSQDDLVSMTQTMAETENAIHRELYSRAKDYPKEILEWLKNRVVEFEKKVKEISTDVAHSTTITAAHLQAYSGELLFLKRLAIAMEENIDQSILPDVFSEIHYLVVLCAENEALFKDTFISKKLDEIRAEALHREVRVFQEETDRLLIREKKNIQDIWEILGWGSAISPNISRSDPNHKSLRENCKQSRENLKSYLSEHLEKLNYDDKLELLQKFFVDLHEKVDEISIVIQDYSLSKSIKTLCTLKEDIEWLKSLLKKACKETQNAQPLEKNYKKICKVYNFLTVEIQEKKLQERLEKIFGKKFVAFFENFILFLIFLVIALLVVEGTCRFSEYKFNIEPTFETYLKACENLESIDNTHPFYQKLYKKFQENGYTLFDSITIRSNVPSKEWEISNHSDHKVVFYAIKSEDGKKLDIHLGGHDRHVFLIIDTVICFIFLLEFFTKWLLVEGKLRYFWRHFFIDFIPSLPFGLFFIGLQNLDYTRSARILRLLRLQNLIRYVRILRPIVRIFRVFVFLLRGLDRLVNRYSRWLNRNIIFFGSQEEVASYREPSLRQRIQELRANCIFKSRTIFGNLSPEESRPFLLCYLVALEVRLLKSNGGMITQDDLLLKSEILVEDVMDTLLNLRGNQVEEVMGRQFPYLIHQYCGFFKAPLIRHLPLIKQLVEMHTKYAPPEFTARIGRNAGRLIECVLSVIYWFSDLYGIVTGPRLLDRVAHTLITSFQSPAKKLFFIGSIFLLANLLFQALPLPILQTVLAFLDRYIGTPLFIIGGICLIPLSIGFWLKNVAGEATEFYEKTAEAQFINLMKELKLKNAKNDLAILYKRVIRPEMLLECQPNEDSCSSGFVVKKMLNELSEWQSTEEKIGTNITTRQEAGRWSLRRSVILLYKDYLDGPLLHHGDVKTTEQLLGNIALGNIRIHRLAYTRKEFKDLARLDLEKHRIFTGPYLWFTLMTQSIAHNSAQLLIDYNKHCIAESLMEVQPEEAQSRYTQWVRRRLKKSNFEPSVPTEEISSPKRRKKRKNAIPVYLTNQFNVLHFLTIDTDQDETIRFHFGETLYQVFLKDRKELVRTIFGTYPLRKLPKSQRSINFYKLYQKHMVGGRIFFLPFAILGYTISSIGKIIKWVYSKIKEILHPLECYKTPISPEADYEVAVRKINRMRKPVYMACMKLRAKYDFEYLGLALPWTIVAKEESNFPGADNFLSTLEKDLHFIKALDSEKDYFQELISERKKQLHRFVEFVHKNGWQEKGFSDYLLKHNPNLDTLKLEDVKKRKNEILRAMAIAYTINYRSLASLISARETLEDVFQIAISNKGSIPGYRWTKRLYTFFSRLISRYILMLPDWEKQSFDGFWHDKGYEKFYGLQEKKWSWKAYLANRTKLKDVFLFIQEEGDIAIIDEILQQIIRNPSPWSEELIALRTIQTLSVMDVQNYRRHVARVGGYQDEKITIPLSVS